MPRLKKPTDGELLRLDAIAKHLKIKARYPDPNFTSQVTAACLARVAPVVDKLLPCKGEEIALALGECFCLTFEEVHGPSDVIYLENRYLKGKREIGFAQLRKELDDPGVDALLFERMNADESDRDRWVAVLNLQDSAAKAYWNRFHELSHRIAEPPQGTLPFRRHKFEASNPIEALIDSVAAELAFYAPAFRPLVERFAGARRLDFSAIRAIRETYSPTASLLAALKSVVKYWPSPAAALTAEFRGRLNSPGLDQALRVTPQGYSSSASRAGLKFFPNMRVPEGTPIQEAFETGIGQDSSEQLGSWHTSQGQRLSPLAVYTSARMFGDRVYALVSV
jgi:hypothetical protein